MDRDEVARAERRRQALDALEFEREREATLREQLQWIVAELEGPRIDAEAFAAMTPAEAEVVRAALEPGGGDGPEEELLEDDEWFGGGGEASPPDPEEREAEIARLEGEIVASRGRQDAFEHYLDALGR